MTDAPHRAMPRSRFILLLALVCGLALVLRLVNLADRPMHTDEAVNALLLGQVLAGQPYIYDSSDRHGPLLVAFTLPAVMLTGQRSFAALDETVLRAVPAIISGLTPALFALLASMLGRRVVLIAATLWAIAPLPLYFGRYFIHESIFVSANLALAGCAWQAWRRDSRAWAAAAGLALGVMAGCKETVVLNLAALTGAVAVALLATRGGAARGGDAARRLLRLVPWALGVVAVLFVASYSWAGAHWDGPGDFLGSFSRFSRRAGGEGHQKPWWYYQTCLGPGWPGAITGCAALFGAANLLHVRRQPGVWLALWTAATFVVYSIIPYKTPWLALNLWLPFSLLAAAAVETEEPAWMPPLLITVLLGVAAWGGSQALRFPLAAPYAYAHTSRALPDLAFRAASLAGPRTATTTRIAVVAADPWPLPWYLRREPGVIYVSDPFADPGPANVFVTDAGDTTRMEAHLLGRRPQFFEQRPHVELALWPPRRTGRP
jgi:uncharacterized protein (TIGR03663 family)